MTQPLNLSDALEISFMVAREAGATWDEIASELNITPEQARQKAGMPPSHLGIAHTTLGDFFVFLHKS